MLAGITTSAPLRVADAPRHDHDGAASAEKKGVKAKPYPLDFCVVSDEKFEGNDMKPADLVYEGQTIKFCCKKCVRKFKQNPKKYVAKLAAETKKLEVAKGKKQDRAAAPRAYPVVWIGSEPGTMLRAPSASFRMSRNEADLFHGGSSEGSSRSRPALLTGRGKDARPTGRLRLFASGWRSDGEWGMVVARLTCGLP